MPGSTADAQALAQRLLHEDGPDYAPWRGRRRYRQAIANVGLPQHRSEAWRHTNIGRWYQAVCVAAELQAADAAEEAGAITGPADVQVANFGEARAQELAAPHLGTTVTLARQPLAAVNALLLETGFVAHVPPGTRDEAVHIGPLAGRFQHVLVVVAAGAEVTLLEEAAGYAHRFVEIVAGTGARVEHRRRQARSTAHECSLVGVRLAEHGRYALTQSCRGAALRRNDVEIQLAGGAEATVTSAWRLAEEEHLDNQVAVHHLAPGGRSRQTYRGVVGGQARAIIDGHIHIAAGANGTDAALSTKNLIADSRAAVFAKPVLEIHASDVRCAHGATVGTLDEAAIHYLRSRGIDERAARELLVRGFLREAAADAEGHALLGLAA